MIWDFQAQRTRLGHPFVSTQSRSIAMVKYGVNTGSNRMNYHTLTSILFVGAGGFLGSVVRFLVSGLTHRLLPFSVFPYGTLFVNIVGCFLIGIFTGLAELHQVFGPNVRYFLFIGFLGGFTTFSTFGLETVSLARDTGAFKAVMNIGLHLFLGLTAVWLGQSLTSLNN